MTEYAYARSGRAVRARNVGWLGAGVEFRVSEPTESLLESLWRYCMVSVEPSRGIHACPFCPPSTPVIVERGGSRVILGSAEIRVFSAKGLSAFASPNLIYHYVAVHRYRPPGPFLEALVAGPSPDDLEY